MAIIAPKGTKDIMPDQVGKWQYIENKIRKLCKLYGFTEIRTPIFEYTELFTRGVGDTTDIVQKEMYTFDDLGKRSLTLKPEGTSPTARAFVEHKVYAQSQPTKYFYITPCFRYERPQAGRQRQFHQFGIEIFGSKSPLADGEVIAFASNLLEEMGIKNLQLKINSVGCPKCRTKHREALMDFLGSKKSQLCETCQGRFHKNPMRILDCKNPNCQKLTENAPLMLDYLCDECRDSFVQLKENLDAYEIKYTVDPTIVRGLDYYTKTAFEFVSTEIGAQGTVCGGGRYDHLIEEVGGPETAGVGFGLGIERLLMLMEKNNFPFPKEEKPKVFIAVLGEEGKAHGIKLLNSLRANNIHAEMDLCERNIKGQFKYADKLDARYTVVIGEEEIKKGVVTLKDMENSTQREVELNKLVEEIGSDK